MSIKAGNTVQTIKGRCRCGGGRCSVCVAKKILLQQLPLKEDSVPRSPLIRNATTTQSLLPVKENVRGRARVTKAKEDAMGIVQTSKWFDLPGEVRNIIYDHATEEAEYEIRWLSRHRRSLTNWRVKSNKAHLGWKSRVENSKSDEIYDKPNTNEWTLSNRMGSDLRKRYNEGVFDMCINLTGPAAWLSTCRQMHDEGGEFFYSKTKFGFRGRVLLGEFIRRLSPSLAASIPELFFRHVVHGEPYRVEHEYLKARDDERWIGTCDAVAKKLTGKLRLAVYSARTS
jgi:hypothetical protein